MLDFQFNQVCEKLANQNPRIKVDKLEIQESNLESSSDEKRYDMIISNFSLQTNENLEEALKGLKTRIEADGALLGVIPGSDTLNELRKSIFMADNERNGGFEEKLLKLQDPQSFGSLLQKVDYSFASIFVDQISMQFPNVYELLDKLNNWGMGNINSELAQPCSENLLLAICAIYSTFFNNKKDPLKIDATFQLLRFIGYQNAPGQTIRKKKEFTVTSFKEFAQNNKNDPEFEGIKFGVITEEDGARDIPISKENEKQNK